VKRTGEACVTLRSEIFFLGTESYLQDCQSNNSFIPTSHCKKLNSPKN
jgi:hypothetical protein